MMIIARIARIAAARDQVTRAYFSQGQSGPRCGGALGPAGAVVGG
jgi:hypothetical protein